LICRHRLCRHRRRVRGGPVHRGRARRPDQGAVLQSPGPAMRQHQLPGGWLRRSLRRFGFDRNPVRRGTDRLQTITRAAVVAVVWAAAPAAAAAAGHAASLSGLHTERAQAASGRGVPAVVLRVTTPPTGWYRSMPPPARLAVPWTSPPGSARTGGTTGTAGGVEDHTRKGWVHRPGRPAHPPPPHPGALPPAIRAPAAAPPGRPPPPVAA